MTNRSFKFYFSPPRRLLRLAGIHENKAHKKPNEFSFTDMTLESNAIEPLQPFSTSAGSTIKEIQHEHCLNPQDFNWKSKFQDRSFTSKSLCKKVIQNDVQNSNFDALNIAI